MKNNKFIVVIISIIVITNCALILPRLIKYQGMLLSDVGENNGYKYAYGTAKDYGLYRKSIDGGNYEKISDAAPLNKDQVFFDGDELYYSSTSYSIVKINLNTLETDKYHNSTKAFSMIGINKNYIVAKDFKNEKSLIIFDKDTLEYVIIIELNTRDMIITDENLQFKDSESGKSYQYNFKEDQLIEK